jgi:polysaccharide pyruvyl transferase WcaK-like protein
LRDAQKEGAVHLDPLEPARILQAQRQQVFGKLLNQRTMRRVFQWTRPLTGWPMPNDTGTQFWRKGTLFGLGYAVFQYINCTFSNNPWLRPLLRLLPLVTLAKVMGRKRAHAKAARRNRNKGDAMGPRIAIIGSYTGRNAGDAAILENVVRDIAEQAPDARLEVFTINPGFVRRTYAGLPLKPIATLPWNLSVKTLGLPILLAALRCDAIIVTSAILFDRKYWNPLYNYLTSLQLVLPLAKRLGKAVFFYSVGVGPIYTERGRRIVRNLIEKSDGITLREEASVDIMRDLGIEKQPVMAADPALNQQIPDTVREEVRTELDRRIGAVPRVSINVNAYLDDWTGREGEGRLGREEFCRIMGEVARRIVDDWGWGVVIICTHFMDEGVTRAVADAAARPDRVMVMENRQYDHRQLMAAMAATEFMIGMRLHCQILAVAAGTPCVALNYAPKVRHFMRMASLEEYTIDFGGGFGADTVLGVAQRLREELAHVRPVLAERVAELQEQAKRSAIELARVLDRREA